MSEEDKIEKLAEKLAQEVLRSWFMTSEGFNMSHPANRKAAKAIIPILTCEFLLTKE